MSDLTIYMILFSCCFTVSFSLAQTTKVPLSQVPKEKRIIERHERSYSKRLSLIGGLSVCVLPGKLSDGPDLSAYKTPKERVKFYDEDEYYQKEHSVLSSFDKKAYLDVHAIELKKSAYLKNKIGKLSSDDLIEYYLEQYAPIDSTYIYKDTLEIGKFKQQYLFVDLRKTRKFYRGHDSNKDGFIYSTTHARLMPIGDYLYVFYTHAIRHDIIPKKGIQKTRKNAKIDFKRLIRSIRIDNNKLSPKK